MTLMVRHKRKKGKDHIAYYVPDPVG